MAPARKPSSTGRTTGKRLAVDSPRAAAIEVLEPILRFMQQSGISEKDAIDAFSRAWSRAAKDRTSKVRLTELANPQPYVDAVTRWARDPAYLNTEGLPRDLPVRGKRGFAALLKASNCEEPVQRVVETLRTYGNIQVLASGKVRLRTPFLHVRAGRNLAFEPNIQFLVDAARNVRASLRDSPTRGNGGSKVKPFWRAVEAQHLSKRAHAAFLAYVRQCSLTFLQDIDDWLVENGGHGARNPVPRHRVGLGLFTIGLDG
jgi:hypothetical protein